MSHPRGTVTFEADGKRYTLKYSINTICDIETAYGKGIQAVAADIQAHPTVSDIRKIFAFGLAEHHPNVTVPEAGTLIDAVGFMRISTLLNESLSGGLGVKAKESAEGKAAGPLAESLATGSAS